MCSRGTCLMKFHRVLTPLFTCNREGDVKSSTRRFLCTKSVLGVNFTPDYSLLQVLVHAWKFWLNIGTEITEGRLKSSRKHFLDFGGKHYRSWKERRVCIMESQKRHFAAQKLKNDPRREIMCRMGSSENGWMIIGFCAAWVFPGFSSRKTTPSGCRV